MLEEFRQQANTSFLFEEEPVVREVRVRTKRELFGMTPFQRFVVAALLLLMTVLISAFCLLVTSRVLLPLN